METESTIPLKTTGKYSQKNYKCRNCGKEKLIGTNHWGAVYPSCACSRGGPAIWDCLEPVPEGYTKPEEWKIMRLGDVCKIV